MIKPCASHFTVKLSVNVFEKLSLWVFKLIQELWRHSQLLAVLRDQQTAVSQGKGRDIFWSDYCKTQES